MNATAYHASHEPTKPAMWLGVIGSGAIWSAQFIAIYALVPHVCKIGGANHLLILHILAAIALFLIAGCFLVSYINWNRAADVEGPGPEGRIVFMAGLGMMLSALFFLITIGQAIAPFFIDPCWA